MKIKFFTILAVLFFSVNIIHAKEKQPLKAKKDTFTVNKSLPLRAILKAEEAEQNNQTIVYVRDTVQTVDIMNLDWSTAEKSKQSVIYLFGLFMMLIPSFSPKFKAWAKKEKSTQALKVIGALLAIITPIAIFGFDKSNVWELVKDILALVAIVGGVVGLGINPITRFLSAKK